MTVHAWLEWCMSLGYPGLFVVLAVGVILPLPDDTTLLFAGYLVSRGQFALVPTWLAAYLGCMTGITISYMIGRSFGLAFVRRFGHYVGITPQRLERTTKWFHRIGKWGLLLGYFVPGVRHLTALAAGSSKLRFPVFVVFSGFGALIWCSVFLSLGYCLKDGWKQFDGDLNQHRLGIVIVTVLIMAAALVIHWCWRRKRRLLRQTK